MRNQIKILIVGLLLIVQPSFAQSNDSSSSLYLGIGSADDSNPYESDNTPWAVGWVSHLQDSNASWGLEIAGAETDNKPRLATTTVSTDFFNIIFSF